MRQIIILCIVVMGVISCQKKRDIDYAIVKGVIKNHSDVTTTIMHNGETRELSIDETGMFTDTLRSSEGYNYHSLSYGDDQIVIYAEPGDDLTMKFDANDFLNTIGYSGVGAGNNNYLVEKKKVEIRQDSIIASKVGGNGYDKLYSVEEEMFLTLQSDKRNTIRELLGEVPGVG